MKTVEKISLLFVICLLVFLPSCDDNLEFVNNPSSGQVSIEAMPDNSLKVSFKVKAQQVTIDWGDGKQNKYSPNGQEQVISHKYKNGGNHNLLIKTQEMTSFSVVSGDIFKIIFGECDKLKTFYCIENWLQSIDIRKALSSLEVFDCQANNLKSLNLSGATSLISLNCKENQLTSINLSGCDNLERLWCETNKISTLDISNLTNLQKVDCEKNPRLTTIQASNCISLSELTCYESALTSLYIDNCVELEILRTYDNALATLTVNDSPYVRYIDIDSNSLSSISINDLFTSLPITTFSEATVNIKNNPGVTTANRSIAENKGWKVIY